MIEFAAQADFSASPASVWRVMTDIAREPEWMRAVKRVEFVGDPRRYTEGARMRRSGAFLWFDLSWESEIVACEAERLVVFKHTGGALEGESRWAIEAIGGGSRVTLASLGPAPGPMAWFPVIAAAAGRAGLKGDLTRLKRLVEATEGAARPYRDAASGG